MTYSSTTTLESRWKDGKIHSKRFKHSCTFRSVLDAKAKNKVYSIVFLGYLSLALRADLPHSVRVSFAGVNGVGKSTNLAKVAYYLKHKGGFKVLMVACDTFRAGAVEQLRCVHSFGVLS